MAKELFIVFVYDTEVFLREEEDPQRAIVFFHPSWVSANRRMALCGQLMGVAQFLVTDFAFPRLISLVNGKFTMRKIGRFILCVGTDRNIPDWILSKRCEILYHTLQFFHANLNSFGNSTEDEIGEKLSGVMEIYLPVLLYPGNIFGNSPTIRLPKSGSSIFLEAAQLLEGLQDHNDVYGGAIFYQNKVVMSQLSVDITKQISITDPFRIKIPAKWISSSLNIPTGVQLLTVYINDDELNQLFLHKMPSGFDRKNSDTKRLSSTNFPTDETDNVPQKTIRGLTLVEEESDFESSPTKNGPNLSYMPDIVKDTVKLLADDEKKNLFSNINVESFVVESRKNLHNLRYCSTDSLDLVSIPATRYHSFKLKEEETPPALDKTRLTRHKRTLRFYNTITDPTNAWFRQNGLPASKALREDHISLFCQDLNLDQEKSTSKQIECLKLISTGRKRPTNIDLNPKDSSKVVTGKSTDSSLPSIKGFTESTVKNEVLLTPLMSKLSLMQLSEEELNEALLTPATSLRCLNDESLQKKKKSSRKSFKKSNFRSESRHWMTNLHGCDKHLTKAILFVFGYQNISTYLLLNIECEKDPDFIHRLWKSCADGVKNLERHFQQCFEGIPQTQPLNAINDSYGYLHLHSRWDTLQHGGVWTPRQTDVVNTICEHFTSDTSLTDVTVRFEDCVIYGNQTADNQTYYQQQVEHISGLPTPSDPMGLISLKAKRRIERDYGMLVI